MQAVTTLYTVTNKRVAMRVGAALTVTLNLPYTQVQNAALALRRNGTGTIVLDVGEGMPLGYVMCWPHLRPWRIRPVQPALRCIPNAEKVAALIAEAAEARIAMPRLEKRAPGVQPVAAE